MAAPDVEIDDGKGILLSVLCVINISSFSCDGCICDQSKVAKWLLSVSLVSDQPVYITTYLCCNYKPSPQST